jgi:Ankyrin repeats (3 copies)/Ankyrin repeats (many copies)
VLLQLDEKVDKKRLATFPLAFYVAEHWVNHAKFEDVTSRVQDTMEHLFNPKRPYLAAWTWIHDVECHWPQIPDDILPVHPPPVQATALYYAALCGFCGLANYLILTHGEDVNAKSGGHGLTPLLVASYEGHLDVARLLLDHGADINSKDNNGKTPLVAAYHSNNLEAMRLLLERGADANTECDGFGLVLHDASYNGQAEVIELLLRHNADVNARSSTNWTPLHWASRSGHSEVIQLLLDNGADINAQF